MDSWRYLIVLRACLLISAPLKLFGRGVYRQPRPSFGTVLPVAVVFLICDASAVAADVWRYNPRYILGLIAPGDLPLEEILFFMVIPLCGLLTYSAAVDDILAMVSRRRAAARAR